VTNGEPGSSADLTQAAGLQASPGRLAGLTAIKVAANATRQLRFNAGPGVEEQAPAPNFSASLKPAAAPLEEGANPLGSIFAGH
jgi:hypothetical protein